MATGSSIFVLLQVKEMARVLKAFILRLSFLYKLTRCHSSSLIMSEWVSGHLSQPPRLCNPPPLNTSPAYDTEPVSPQPAAHPLKGWENSNRGTSLEGGNIDSLGLRKGGLLDNVCYESFGSPTYELLSNAISMSRNAVRISYFRSWWTLYFYSNFFLCTCFI